MGCGASHMHKDFGVEDVHPNSKPTTPRPDGQPALDGNGVSKNRMESKFPWEVDGSALPEDVTIVFVLGVPGAGKSTQCQLLADAMQVSHVNTGELLRREVELGTTLGKWVDALVREGALVPTQVMITLLKKALLAATQPTILVDGYPRTVEQLETFNTAVCPAHAALYLDMPEDVAVQRMHVPDKADHDEAALLARVRTAKDQATPIIEFFEHQGRGFTIDASGDVESVQQAVAEAYRKVETQRIKELEDMEAKARANRTLSQNTSSVSSHVSHSYSANLPA